jgi:hypothetical protein
MARNPYITYFDPRDQACRTVREWRGARGQTWRSIARAYARLHGEAKVLQADGHVVHYRRTTEGTIRQRTYTRVVMVRVTGLLQTALAYTCGADGQGGPHQC